MSAVDGVEVVKEGWLWKRGKVFFSFADFRHLSVQGIIYPTKVV